MNGYREGQRWRESDVAPEDKKDVGGAGREELQKGCFSGIFGGVGSSSYYISWMRIIISQKT